MQDETQARLLCREGTSDKFWRIKTEGDSFYVHYGKNGTLGRVEVKVFEEEDECRNAAKKIIAEKLKKGYVAEQAGGSSETGRQAELEQYKSHKAEVLDIMLGMKKAVEEDGEEWVSSGHIAACGALADAFCDCLKNCLDDKSGMMHCVKNIVCAYNVLNEEADYNLIETDEREAIYAFLCGAVKIAGFDPGDEDITEEWREW